MLENKGVRDDGYSDFDDFGEDNLTYKATARHKMTLKVVDRNEGIDDREIQRFRE
jgi:hypothetical protein